MLRTKTIKIMYLIHFSAVMLQSHNTLQTKVIKLYINYTFMIVDINFSRADLLSLLVSF